MFPAWEQRELTQSLPVQMTLFSPTTFCVIGISPFFPNISVGSTLMRKLSMDALKAAQLPYLAKNIFLYQCGCELRAV